MKYNFLSSYRRAKHVKPVTKLNRRRANLAIANKQIINRLNQLSYE